VQKNALVRATFQVVAARTSPQRRWNAYSAPALVTKILIMRQTMEINDFLNEEFWSGVYRGHSIALLNRSERWRVYLDHTLQHRYVFASASHAKAWLMRRIDEQCDARAVAA
jgi:hypothetical protein